MVFLRNIFYISLFFVFIHSGPAYQVSDGADIDIDEGLVFFKVTYLEDQDNKFFENILLKLKNFESNRILSLNLKKNESQYIVYKVNAGIYFLEHLVAEKEKEFGANPSSTEKYKGNFFQHAFKIYPLAINYIGDIKVSSDIKNGKQFYIKRISNDIPDKKFLYLLHSFLEKEKDMEWLKVNYSKFLEKYPIVQVPIKYDNDALALKAQFNVTNNFTYGYKYENYGVDENGYHQFKWKSSLENFKNIFQKSIYKDLPYQILSETESVDHFNVEVLKGLNFDDKVKKLVFLNLENTNIEKIFNEKAIYFHFSSLNASYWKDNLYKVTFHIIDNFENIMKKLTYKYGFSVNKDRIWYWELPNTRIYLYGNQDTYYLSYTSKYYNELSSANIGND